MAEKSGRRKPPLPKVSPWLVIPYGKGMKNQAFYNLCEPDNRTCRKSISELSGKSFYQKPSHQGWLIIVCDNYNVDYTPSWNFGDCFLWNPATLDTIQLPNILSAGYTYDEYYFMDYVLSSPPRTATTSTNLGDGNDSMVFFVLERRADEYDYVFLFCRPGDKQWRTHKFSRDKIIGGGDNNISSLHYLEGNLYAMSCSRFSNYKIEIEKVDDDSVNLSVRLFKTSDHTYFPCIGGTYTSLCATMYVQTFDEFYRLDLHYTNEGEELISVDVSRLDFSIMGWKEVNSLGDNVLFLGENTIACCSAAELGLPRGCLYYTLPNNQSLYKFELEGTGTIILPCLKLPTPWFPSEWIMMTTNFRVEDGQEIIESMSHKREEAKDYIVDPKVMSTSLGNKSNENDVLNNTFVSPCLVYSITNDCTVYKFVDPMHNNENYFMKLPLLGGARIRFQKGGWLLMSEGARRLFFHNPFTKETIELPDLPWCYAEWSYDLSNISFSSLPTCSDCVVYGIQVSRPTSIGVYLIARGENSWRYRAFGKTHMKHYMPLLNTPALHEGILYCVDYNGVLGALNLEGCNSWNYKVFEEPRAQFNRAHPSFLVECGGDLILVKLGRIGMVVGVFRLDFSRMVWVRIKSLGKHMLFISYTSCVSRIAPNSGMENKIYFPRLSLQGDGILYYSLETGGYHCLGTHHASKDFSDSKGWSSWSWIEPNWARSTVQELDWTTSLL